jgi:hypothetical protein
LQKKIRMRALWAEQEAVAESRHRFTQSKVHDGGFSVAVGRRRTQLHYGSAAALPWQGTSQDDGWMEGWRPSHGESLINNQQFTTYVECQVCSGREFSAKQDTTGRDFVRAVSPGFGFISTARSMAGSFVQLFFPTFCNFDLFFWDIPVHGGRS